MNIPPFGTYELNRREQFSRRWGTKLGRNPFSKIARTLLKNLAGCQAHRPRDVQIFGDQRARLHPYDNICEKRVFLTPHLWETDERAHLNHYIQNNHDAEEFFFVDAGANVGLYTLYARHCASYTSIKFRGVCVEPGQQTTERLQINLTLSQAEEEIQLFKVALSDGQGHAVLAIDHANLGESSLQAAPSDQRQSAQSVQTQSLKDIIIQAGFPRVDALKIDIEGQEYPVLKAFFRTSPESLWPRFVIMEIAHANRESELISLFIKRGYRIENKSRGNIVLIRRPQTKQT